MLWSIRAHMKPAFTVIEMIPNVHRTQALAALRKAVSERGSATLRLTPEEKDLAFYDAPVQLISPIGARLLKALFQERRIKLKKPGNDKLPALDAYIATEAAFRVEVTRLEAEEATARARLAEIVADPALARPEELTSYLIDKVITAHLGHGAYGSLLIGGLTCHKTLIQPEADEDAATRAEGRVICWWLDSAGARQGDAA